MSDFTIGYDARYSCFVETADIDCAKRIATQLEAELGTTVTFMEISNDGYQFENPYACFQINFEGELDVDVDGDYSPATRDFPEESPDFYYSSESELKTALDKEMKTALKNIDLPSFYTDDEISINDDTIHEQYKSFLKELKAECEAIRCDCDDR